MQQFVMEGIASRSSFIRLSLYVVMNTIFIEITLLCLPLARSRYRFITASKQDSKAISDHFSLVTGQIVFDGCSVRDSRADRAPTVLPGIHIISSDRRKIMPASLLKWATLAAWGAGQW